MSVVIYEVRGAAAYLTINRPECRNALSAEVFEGLRSGVHAAGKNPSVRALVLAGAGDRAFCAGGDLRNMNAETDEFTSHYSRAQLAGLLRDLWEVGKPTIARVQGYALAGGFGLALACDFVVASNRAVFGAPEVKAGLWPYMITVPLLHSLRPKDALRLMLTGEHVSAEEGVRLGFVSHLAEHDELDPTIDSLVAELSKVSPQAISLGRTAFYSVLNHDLDARFRMLEASLSVNVSFSDAKEGLTAFSEKRDPVWRREE
jgi:enoyl-CoA hydratase